MNSQDFIRVMHEAFEPFLVSLGFIMEPISVSGRYYRASFGDPKKVISVSYEPGDKSFFIMVFSRENGGLSDVDDRLKTPRLSDLNSRYMHLIGNDERIMNEQFFRSVVTHDQEERLLLKFAKELRLVLPRYLD